jgi:hypothetical protein
VILHYALLFALVVWVLAHLALVLDFARQRSRRGYALLALVLPPVAPLMGFQQRMRARSLAWVLSSGAFVLLRAVAQTL